jgi:hypothetical protein
MGRQDSLIQLTGGIGNLSFYKTEDGYLARKRSGVSAKRMQSDPRFQRTRENAAEFTRAGQATKLLRTAFVPMLKFAADRRLTSRLTSAMMKAIVADTVSVRGQRNAVDGHVQLLQGIEFNLNAQLSSTLRAQYTATIDRATGALVVDVAAFVPADMISAAEGATHFRLRAGGSAIDFAGNTTATVTSETAALPISQHVQEPLQLTQVVTPGSVHPLFLVFGIEFLQLVNGVQYPLKSGAHNAMAIVKVDEG